MGLYNMDPLEEGFLDEDEFDYDALDEACAISLLSRTSDEELKAFIQSEECESLITEGKISRKQIVRLNKNSDLTRRQTLAAYQIAKDKNDINWQKFIKYKTLANQYKHNIIEKFGHKSEVVAKKSQRNFISGKGTEASVKASLAERRNKELAAGRAGRV